MSLRIVHHSGKDEGGWGFYLDPCGINWWVSAVTSECMCHVSAALFIDLMATKIIFAFYPLLGSLFSSKVHFHAYTPK